MSTNVGLAQLPGHIGAPSSVLTDGDIEDAMKGGYLFSDGADPGQVKYSTYELRVAGYELLTFQTDEDRWSSPQNRQANCVVLEPGETARVFAEEVLEMPSNVMGHATPVGQLFSNGLAAESTFADPGYKGDLYVTLINLSTKVLSIPFGSPLARLEFYKLGKAVTRPHNGTRRSAKFVTPSRPASLTPAELASREPREWLQIVGEFTEAERYDKRHQISSYVVEHVDTRLARAEHAIVILEAAALLLAAVKTGLTAFAAWPLMPNSIEKDVSKGLIAVVVAALVAVPMGLFKPWRARMKALFLAAANRK